ncbi:MAG: hypothetical protein R6W87_07345 [Halospina sp.]
MDPSTFAAWEGANAVFTFGPGSAGMWLFLLVAIGIGIGVLGRMIIHENQTFRSLDPDLVKEGGMRGANI